MEAVKKGKIPVIKDAYNTFKIPLEIKNLLGEDISKMEFKEIVEDVKKDFNDEDVTKELDSFVSRELGKDFSKSTDLSKGTSLIKRDSHFNSSNKNE